MVIRPCPLAGALKFPLLSKRSDAIIDAVRALPPITSRGNPMKMSRRTFLAAGAGALGSAAVRAAPAGTATPDVVVYGATPAGIVAAVAAAREGASVRLLVPGTHIGGMMTGGLSDTDTGDRADVIGGYAREVFTRIAARYGRGAPSPDDERQWDFEPSAAGAAFAAMLAEADVAPLLGRRLRERGGVAKSGGRITAIALENGEIVRGTVFIDATYEGDLMARAGVDHVWGREGRAQYGEGLAGVQPDHRTHNFSTLGVEVSPYAADGSLIAGFHPGPRGALGAGDRKVQAYTFRATVTDRADNRIPFPRPAGYDPARYELHRRTIEALIAKNGRPPTMNELVIRSPLPNGKYDINNRGPVSTNNVNRNWAYPDGGYATRAAILRDHVAHVQGYFHFLANDRRLPAILRDEVASYGLPRDEFVETGNWTPQLYVREARRMVGAYVMRQSDIQTDVAKADGIGMGSYRSDSHNVQRFVNAAGLAECEGNMEVTISPYEIPYRILTPRAAQAENLLVPAAFSASHVTYSTVRMEPQYMILGQAAGVAAARAARDRSPVQRVDVASLRERLRGQGAVLTLPARA